MGSPQRPATGGTSISRGNPWVFFGVTYAVTWSLWLSAVALGVSFNSAEGAALLILGLLGPGASGVGFVYLVYGTEGRADFWRRLTRIRRIGVRWSLVILLTPIAVTVVAAALDLLVGGPGVTLGESVRALNVDPLAILPALFFATLPPLLEEVGWRGYALDRLQMNRSALGASLILGVVWAVWHLPLFFVEGSFQREVIGFATAGFWLFMIGIVALSVIFTWAYNHTARSILGIVLFHGWVNFVSEAVEVADQFYYPVWVLAAVLVVGIWGARSLRGAEDVPRPPPDAGTDSG